MEKTKMRIKKGVSTQENGQRVEERGYCKRCARSLHELLKENKEVEITAMGSLAVANVMKTIVICTQLFEAEGEKMEIHTPCYKMEDIKTPDGKASQIAVFSITAKV